MTKSPRPTRFQKNTSVLLSDDNEAFIQAELAAGHYTSASEVVREAVAFLADQKRKERWLIEALDHGLASPIAPDGVFERAHARLEEYIRRRESR